MQLPCTQGGVGEHSLMLVLQVEPVQPVIQVQLNVPGPVACGSVCACACACACIMCVCVCA